MYSDSDLMSYKVWFESTIDKNSYLQTYDPKAKMRSQKLVSMPNKHNQNGFFFQDKIKTGWGNFEGRPDRFVMIHPEIIDELAKTVTVNDIAKLYVDRNSEYQNEYKLRVSKVAENYFKYVGDVDKLVSLDRVTLEKFIRTIKA